MRNQFPALMWLIPFTALCVSVGCSSGHKEEEEKPKPVVAVKTMKVQSEDVQITVQAPATIFPREQANVASRITAPIVSLGAQKGGRVEAGHILAKLDNRDLVAQRREAAAQVTDASATLEKTRSGTVPAELERARGQVATSQASLNQAEKFYQRRQQLFEQGAIPNRDLVVSQTELATARSNFEVAQRSLALLEKQSSGRDIEVAQSRLEQARARLSAIDAQIAFSEVKSPFSGFVTEQFVFPGDMAQPSTPMFTIADLAVAVARAQVPEAEAGSVRRGESCRFAPADHEDSAFAGRVSVVNQAVDPARRTVEVWCEISNGRADLRAQVFGTLQITTGQLVQAITLPVSAVQYDEGSRNGFVMTVGADRKAHKKAVETRAPANGRTVVLKGLSPGDTVIVEGSYGLADGTSVTVGEDTRK